MYGDIYSGKRVHPMPPRRSVVAHPRPVPKIVRSNRAGVDVRPCLDTVHRKFVPKEQKVIVREQPRISPVQPIEKQIHHADVPKSHLGGFKAAVEHHKGKQLDKRSAHKRKSPKLLYAAACLIVLVGVLIVIQGVLVNNKVQEQVQVLSQSTDQTEKTEQASPVPSEEKVNTDTIKSYKVAADLPRIINIPAFGEQARVLQVGVDTKNQLLTPKNIYDTAWYTGSSKPGEMGAAVIDGHFVGPTTNGVFSRLSQMKQGEKIVIERGDGKQLTFAVVALETVPVDKVDMIKILNSAQPAKPGLNLITCGGKYDPKTFEFSDRTIVYAVQV